MKQLSQNVTSVSMLMLFLSLKQGSNKIFNSDFAVGCSLSTHCNKEMYIKETISVGANFCIRRGQMRRRSISRVTFNAVVPDGKKVPVTGGNTIKLWDRRAHCWFRNCGISQVLYIETITVYSLRFSLSLHGKNASVGTDHDYIQLLGKKLAE